MFWLAVIVLAPVGMALLSWCFDVAESAATNEYGKEG